MEQKRSAKQAVEDQRTENNKALKGRRSAKYKKEQFLYAERYRERRDLIQALLKEGQEYSLEEADRLLEDYLKEKVR